eukprot:TRINITY_DN72777_c0_g1_i1.p1 TRINITY_DN72777_c0_g1~~TRINITY_DN72777_c0_g1_i1.p1  ORF type:complete len:731 (-),score=125.46 TRINITY_DN72777_c0_g1_i1:284-2476(-)
MTASAFRAWRAATSLQMSGAPEPKNRLTYAVELPCSEPDTRHWRHPWCYAHNGGELALVPPLVASLGKPCTIAGAFDACAERYGGNPMLGTRRIEEETLEGKKRFWKKGPYEWKSYYEVYKEVRAAASGLMALPEILELRKEKKCVAALLADTSAEWQTAAQAAFQCGIPITTVYTTLGHEAMLYGLNQTETSILFVDWELYDKLKEPVLSQCASLRHIVLIGECFVPRVVVGGAAREFPDQAAVSKLPPIGKAITTTLKALIQDGAKSPTDLQSLAPTPDDLAFIMYTSGSTGLPKGVMLTHRNFIAVVAGVLAHGCFKPSADDVYIAYLPLAHIMELMVETVMVQTGGKIGYGHPRTLTGASVYVHPSNADNSDLLALLPTLMVAVPAVLEVIKTGLQMKLKGMGGLKGKLARGAVCKKLGMASKEGMLASCLLSLGLADKVLGKLKAGLGLQFLRCLASGGAPLSSETQEFVANILAPVAQGYGATETLASSTIQEVFSVDGRPADRTYGGVGSIVPCVELKLKSVPDMGYLITDDPPRGEVLLAGNTVSQEGYYGMPEKSREDFPVHSDGKVWFHTGDVGVMTAEGTLRIIDRKKDLIKLSGGEYVSLGKVEAGLKQVPGIGAVAVFARPDKDHCVCIVSQPEKGWASVGGKPIEEDLVASIAAVLRKQGLARFEIPTKVRIDDAIWTPESGLVTASLKIQRTAMRKHYNSEGGLLAEMDYGFAES